MDSWLSQYRQLRLKAMPLSCGSRERDDALVEKTPASAHDPLGVLNKNEPKSCKICQTFFEPDLTLFSTAEAKTKQFIFVQLSKKFHLLPSSQGCGKPLIGNRYGF